MNPHLKQAIAATVIALGIQHAHAHNAWIEPSATLLENGGFITVTGTAGHEMFSIAGHNHPLRNLEESLNVMAPDGSKIKPENAMQGKLRSVLDLNLTQKGTYRLTVLNNVVVASWKEGAATKRFRGNAEGFGKAVPAQAQELKVNEFMGRIESFVTVGETSPIKPSGAGLEMVPITHPNALLAGKPSEFRFEINGKPASGLEVVLVREGVRYRPKLEEVKLTTDAEGKIIITWPQAGLYWLSAGATDDKTSVTQLKERKLSYVATLEVLNEERLAEQQAQRAKRAAENAAQASSNGGEKRQTP